MEQAIMIGLDIAKNVFEVHGRNAAGAVVLRRRLKRAKVVEFFAALPKAVIGMEACSSAHHWARVFERQGHEVRLMPPAYVKPYVKRNKNDGRDAAGCWEAMGRPDMGADESLRGLLGRVERIEEVTAEIAKWTATRTRAEVGALCEKHQVAAAPLRDVVELLNDPHLRERGFLTEQATEHGPVALPNSPMRYQGSELRPLEPPPSLGEHTEQVLSERCGLDSSALAGLYRDGVI